MNKKTKSVNDYIKEYFEAHPNQDIEHGKVVDYVFKFIPKARDPWRAIRMLYQKGWLIQVRKGVDELLHRGSGQLDQMFPVAVDLFNTTISVPIYPALSSDEERRCVEAISYFGYNFSANLN